MTAFDRREPEFTVIDSGDEHLLPLISENHDEEDEPGRRRIPFLIVGSLLAVAFVGGALALAYKQGVREGNRSAPPVIRASRDPVKVRPKKPGGLRIPNQNKLVYDRLEGKPSKITERLMPAPEEVMDLPRPKAPPVPAPETGPTPEVADSLMEPSVTRQPSRTGPLAALKPSASGAGDDTAVSGPAVDVPPPVASPRKGTPLLPGSTEPLIPRKVDVITITPDGIVPPTPRIKSPDSGSSLVGRDMDNAILEAASRPVMTAPKPDPDRERVTRLEPSSRIASRTQEAGNLRTPASSTTGTSTLVPDLPGVRITETPADIKAVRKPPASRDAMTKTTKKLASVLKPRSPVPVRKATAAPVRKERTVSKAKKTKVSLSEPARTTQPAPPPVKVPAKTAPKKPAARKTQAKRILAPRPAASGAYVVQVASHRRQVDALTEFANLRRRSPRLLQGFQPLIQRADLPGKGTYYRLRIGPLASKGDAVRFCQALKAAGKSGCLIRRR